MCRCLSLITYPVDVGIPDPVLRLTPDVKEICDSVGVPTSSQRGQLITRMLTNQVANVQIVNASILHPAADSCHHAHAYRRATPRMPARCKNGIDSADQFDFIFFVNDGVRGPFVNVPTAKVWMKCLHCAQYYILKCLQCAQ